MRDLEAADAALSSRACRVVPVTFSTPVAGDQWIRDTHCRYTLISDEERQLYKMFGLPRSIREVWSLETVKMYAAKKAQGVQLVPMYEDDDPYQLGGDFIIDRSGSVVMAHPSTNLVDRPSIDKILMTLDQSSKNGN